MLHERVQRLPAKRFGQLFRAHWLVTELKIVEDTLEGESNALACIITFRGHLVDGLAQLIGEIESLQQRVHVASGPLILQANKARMLLTVPAHTVRSVRL